MGTALLQAVAAKPGAAAQQLTVGNASMAIGHAILAVGTRKGMTGSGLAAVALANRTSSVLCRDSGVQEVLLEASAQVLSAGAVEEARWAAYGLPGEWESAGYS